MNKIFYETIGSPIDQAYKNLTNKLLPENISRPESRDIFYREVVFTQRKGRTKKVRKTYTPSDNNLKDVHQCMYNWITPVRHSSVKSYEKGDSIRNFSVTYRGCACIGGLDIKDFFPSLTEDVIARAFYEMFKREGNPNSAKEMARKAAWLSAKSSPIDPGRNEAVLPLGITIAPRISNTVFIDIDAKISEYACKHELIYQRYSDNVFIGQLFPKDNTKLDWDERRKLVSGMWEHMNTITGIIESNALKGLDGPGVFLKVNREKTHVMPYWKQERVLGTVVNKDVNVPMVSRAYVRSAFSHLIKDTTTLLSTIENAYYSLALNNSETVRDLSGKTERLAKRFRRIDGYLNWMSSINEDDRTKFMTHRCMVKMAISESQRILAASAEEKKKGGRP